MSGHQALMKRRLERAAASGSPLVDRQFRTHQFRTHQFRRDQCRTALVGLLFSSALALSCSDDLGSESSQPTGPIGPNVGQGTAQPGTLPTGMGSDVPGSSNGAVAGGSSTGTGASNPGTSGTTNPETGNGMAQDPNTGQPSVDPNAVPDVPPPSVLVPTPRLARLSRAQWSNTIRDLLHLEDISDIDAEVSGDALIGFDSQADALYVTESLRRQLATAAERLAERVTADPTALERLVPVDGTAALDERARSFIVAFGLRAFRRPLSDDEVAIHLGLFERGPTLYPGVDEFQAGASLVIQAMLQSPHFLYRTELGTAENAGTEVALDDYEVASKLAFAITNTMPDEELFTAAADGLLQDRSQVEAQARRLLDSPRGSEGIANLNFQVFRLGTYDGIVRDTEVFPEFTPETPAAMRREVQLFFDWTFQEGLGIKDFYTSPVGFVNSTLAPLYGLEGTFDSDTFTMVDLDPDIRSGFLTQAGFLSSYISDQQPDIIHRGVFIATRLLCITLPPPAPGAGSLIDIQPDMTNRQRVEATTGKGTCGEGCHSAFLNPLGYAFENYDAIGKYRTTDRGLPVDASDVYRLDGEAKAFSNGVELSHLLAESKQLHSCYAGNMMSYLHGRVLDEAEDPTVDYYARLSLADRISIRDLALDITTSDAFLKRLP